MYEWAKVVRLDVNYSITPRRVRNGNLLAEMFEDDGFTDAEIVSTSKPELLIYPHSVSQRFTSAVCSILPGMNLSEITNSLQDALKQAAIEEGKLEKAKLSLAPLEEAAQRARDEVNRLIADFQKQTGATPVKAGRGGVKGKRAAYNQSPSSKITASGKRAYTRAVNGGAKPKEAEKAKSEAEASMAAKLGVPVK